MYAHASPLNKAVVVAHHNLVSLPMNTTVP
jgi:hypothetical protein